MNEHTRKIMASTGLEMLKEVTQRVVYEQHRDGSRQFITLREIREHLGLPQGRSGENYLIRGVLEMLELEGFVERYAFDAAWQITEKGIWLFEN